MSCKKPTFFRSAGTVVACGQCTPCLLKKQRDKSGRILLENKTAASDPLFVTLTYDNEHLPTKYLHEKIDKETGEVTSKLYECASGTLYPPDPVNFFKRLRYYASKINVNVRCVYAGEYGDKTARPHYHAIIWGLSYKQRQLFYQSWTDKNKKLMCDPSKLDVQIPADERHVANYVAKYIIGGKGKKDAPSLNGAYPEFYRTSKGLGLAYAEDFAHALKKESGLVNLWLTGQLPSSYICNGKNFPIDRYLKGKILALLPTVFAEELPKLALENYKAEMQSVLDDALTDPSFAHQAYHLPPEKQLELAARLKNAQSALDIEMRHSFFTSKRKNLDV